MTGKQLALRDRIARHRGFAVGAVKSGTQWFVRILTVPISAVVTVAALAGITVALGPLGTLVLAVLLVIVALAKGAYAMWDTQEQLVVETQAALATETAAHEKTRRAREVQHNLAMKPPAVYVHEYDDGSRMLRLGLVFRNSADLPLRYDVESFSVAANGKTLPTPAEFHTSGGVLPRGAETTYTYPDIFGLTAADLEAPALVGYTVLYGHPSGDRFRKTARLELRFPHSADAQARWLTLEAKDDPAD